MYSIKYCGIVDGTMGILSRKVALDSLKQKQIKSQAKARLVIFDN
jgi:hypothetical protein